MGWERKADGFDFTQIPSFPEVANFVLGAFQTELCPTVSHLIGFGRLVKECNICAVSGLRMRRPRDGVAGFEYLSAVLGMLIYR